MFNTEVLLYHLREWFFSLKPLVEAHFYDICLDKGSFARKRGA